MAPLLKLERRDLQLYLADSGQDWREDETNRSEVYFRNLLRHRIIPAMQDAAPGGSRHFAELAEEVQHLHAMVKSMARSFLRRYRQGESLDVTKVPPAFLRREVIRLWLVEAGLGEIANRSLIEQIDRLWHKKGGGRRVLCGGRTFSRSADSLILTESNL